MSPYGKFECQLIENWPIFIMLITVKCISLESRSSSGTECWCKQSLAEKVSISTLIHNNKKQYKKSTILKSLQTLKNITHNQPQETNITNQGDCCVSMGWCSGWFLLKPIYVLNFFKRVFAFLSSLESLPCLVCLHQYSPLKSILTPCIPGMVP